LFSGALLGEPGGDDLGDGRGDVSGVHKPTGTSFNGAAGGALAVATVGALFAVATAGAFAATAGEDSFAAGGEMRVLKMPKAIATTEHTTRVEAQSSHEGDS